MMVEMFTRPQRLALAVAVLAALAIGVYLGALRGGFVWDDYALMDGSAIGGGSLAGCFRSAFLDHYYRPLVSVSFYLDRLWWPNSAAASHWVNIILHALAALAVLGLLHAAWERLSVAMAGALLFAVHPAHVGAVAWIGGRTDVLGMLWTALFAWGLISAAKSLGDRRSIWLAVSVVAYALAVFTKEQSLALLPLVPLAFACFRPRLGVDLPGSGWVAVGPFVVVAAFYLAIGAFLGMPGPPGLWTPLAEHVLRVGQTLAGYSVLLLLPNQTVLHMYSLEPAARWMPWSVLGGCTVSAAVAIAVVRFWKRDRPSLWFLMLAVLALAPVSGILTMPFLLFAPYRGAVATIGVCALAARYLPTLRARVPGMPALPAVLTLSAAACWATVQTLQAIPSWRSEDALFSAMVEHDPGAVVGRFMLARAAVAEGREHDAEVHLTAILDYLFGRDRGGGWDWRRPERAHTALKRDWRVRSRVLQNRGAMGQAEDYLTLLFVHLGYARLGRQDYAGAETAFTTALGYRPRDPNGNVGIGWCLLRRGDAIGGERHARAALEVMPDGADARRILAQALEAQGRYAEAQVEWKRLSP
jgi:hypothetical protein